MEVNYGNKVVSAVRKNRQSGNRASMDMPEIEIAGINVRNADLDYLIYMLKYDTTFGRFPSRWKSMKKES